MQWPEEFKFTHRAFGIPDTNSVDLDQYNTNSSDFFHSTTHTYQRPAHLEGFDSVTRTVVCRDNEPLADHRSD